MKKLLATLYILAVFVSPLSALAADPVKVFIIDSGAGAGITYASKTSAITGVDPNDAKGHGTITAQSFIQGANEYGATNYALYSINAMDKSGPSGAANDLTIATAINTAVDQGANIINLSFEAAGQPSQTLQSAIDRAVSSGAEIVMSAGNQADKIANGNISNSGIIAVGALDPNGNIASYSNGQYGNSAAVDVYEYGTTYDPNSSTNSFPAGTSFAAPRAAGAIAAIMQNAPGGADVNGNGKWDASEVKTALAAGIASDKFADLVAGGRLPGGGDSYASAASAAAPSGSSGTAPAVVAAQVSSSQTWSTAASNPNLSQSLQYSGFSQVAPNGNLSYQPLEPLPSNNVFTQNGQYANIVDYLRTVYPLVVTIGSLIAVVILTIGGVRYMLSEGFTDVDKAKRSMRNALWGLLVLVGSYLLIYTLNPDLLKFNFALRNVSTGANSFTLPTNGPNTGQSGPAAGSYTYANEAQSQAILKADPTALGYAAVVNANDSVAAQKFTKGCQDGSTVPPTTIAAMCGSGAIVGGGLGLITPIPGATIVGLAGGCISGIYGSTYLTGSVKTLPGDVVGNSNQTVLVCDY
ncbi:MAG: S8 family serine peptidase [Patescibacteria group bacterium]